MQKPVEQVWDLTIAPDTVRLIIEKARTISAAVNEDYDDGAEHEVEFGEGARDNHHHDGLAEEETGDQTEGELRQIIHELNVDEKAELIALTWIGRGDYEPAEFADAVNEARQRNYRSTARYLLGMPMLGDWLDEGLEAIGVSAAQ
ncbi:DUF3775 domain-containing protein [Mesorhizobium sp. KR9-304]|uniref:DUF3775 domain-containing protein n=1 Tax=Mesorhizobium sp. KR9-304 TaxID=3156614 RepID=UPI0032B391E5